MCIHGTDTKITIKGKIVAVDSCIAKEILWLNDNGVDTINCCCGHFRSNPEVIITPSSLQKAIKLGYTMKYLAFEMPVIGLKGKDFKEDSYDL